MNGHEDGYLLHSEVELLTVAQGAVDHARAVGAEAASALASEAGGVTIKVRNGAPTSAVRNGGHALSITVFNGGRSGSANSEALDDASIRRAVEHAHAIASQVEPDPEAGLADPSWLAFGTPDAELYAPSRHSPSALTDLALDIERAAHAVTKPGGTNVRIDEAAASSTDTRWARALSNGFARSGSASTQSRACVAIAERGGDMARDWWHVVDRRLDGLLAGDIIAHEAVARSSAKLGGTSLPTQSAPVLLDARIATSLIGDLIGALTGQSQQQRATFLLNALGEQRLAPHISITEDPFEPFGLASSAWDSEGVAASRRSIVRDGVVEGYFLNSRSARKLGMISTGNADGPTNLTLSSASCAPGDDLATMLRKLHRGLFVTQFMGGGVNGATGDYSKAIEGFWVEDGEIVHPVRDVTIAGNLKSMLTDIVAVGSEAYRSGPIRTGPILLETMRIAGR